MAVGTRGDGKTIAALAGMIAHAKRHEQMGYELPVTWMGVQDTFRAHELKTHPSMMQELWGGCWRLRDGGREALCVVGDPPRVLVRMDLFGVEDQGAIDKMRMESHCLWIEEAAPTAVLVQSSGISETAYLTGVTSCRLKTHANVKVITENYPDEDHWTWLRWFVDPQPGTLLFRVPPGERASREQRAEWARALANRPDLLRRLLAGEPGGISLGPEVAEGFSQDLHVAPERLRPHAGEPIFMGQDFGHTPATIIGGLWRGNIEVYAALTCDKGGMKQHLEHTVIPWLSSHAPWVLKQRELINGCYDPNGDTGEQADIEQSPMTVLENMLGGRWEPGPISWDARKGPLLSVFRKPGPTPGTVALQIDPVDGRQLIQSCNGRWYYPQKHTGQLTRDFPKKPNHPWEDIGDAFCYFIIRLAGSENHIPGPIKVETDFDPRAPIMAGAR